MATAASSAQTAVPPAAGDGLTTATAYQIAELGNLVWMSDTVTSSSGKYYTLTGDIDASDTANWNDSGTSTSVLEGFKPIGTYYFSMTVHFQGVLDGAGHTITGLTVDRATTQAAVGLFGSVGTDGRIANLALEGGAMRGWLFVGGLAGQSDGKITNCRTNCSVWGVSAVGGLVGLCFGDITNCRSTGTVTGLGFDAGGLVGAVGDYGMVAGSSATGAVTGWQDVGGLVGNNMRPLTQCFASGQVVGEQYVGGLVGESKGAVTNCYACGPVTGQTYVGGLAGANSSAVGWVGGPWIGTVTASYAVGRVTGQTAVGGLAGASDSEMITSSYWDTQSTGQTASAGGTGQTTAQMKQQATYLPAGPGAGQWDFSAVWGIQGSYPYLRGFPVHTLTYTAGANGSLDGATSQTQTVNEGGRSAAVFATAIAGYHFSHWSDGAKDNPRIDANVLADGSVTALFTNQCTLTYLAGPHGTIAGPTSQTLTQGGNGLTVTAVAATDYHFLRWSDGVMTAARTDLGVANDITVTAFFVPDWCSLTYTASSGGSLDGATSQTVPYAQSGTAVLAVPDPGWCFRRWSDGSTANPRTDANVTANLSVTAQFQPVVPIHTLAELQAIATGDLTANYALMNDIDASVTATWNDAGTTTDTLEGFRPIGKYYGIFEGNGHKITGLTINRAATYGVGLFGGIGTGGIVRNLHLEGGAIAGYGSVGALAGYVSQGTLTSCTATVAVAGNEAVGGLVGGNSTSGTITNCSSGGVTMGTFSVGGLAGGNFSVTGITNCHATGAVTVPSSATWVLLVGGLVGYNAGGTIANCYATGAIYSPAGLIEAGGLVGENSDGSTITNSYATGAVTGNNFSFDMGGLVGCNSRGTIKNCYASGAVTGGGSAIGGLAGVNRGTITACYWDTQTSGQATSDGGTSATTAQMMQQGTYLPAGSLPGQWDFASVWGINGAYPYLRSLPTYTLTYTAGPNGSIDGATSRSQTVNQGVDGGAVAAVPAALHHFVRWSDASTANPRTDTNVVANIAVTATFAPGPNTLTYTAGPGGSITGATSQTVTTGADGTQVTAVPAPHYHFVRWSDGVMTAARTDLNVTSNISVIALFTIDLYHLAYAAGPGGSLDGATSQTVQYGQSGTAVLAVADAGCSFLNWSDGSTANPRTDTNVTANVNVTAQFLSAIQIHTLAELQAIATGDLGATYLLMNDIDATATATWNDNGTTTALVGFRPIGTSGSGFRGVFEGNGHKIVSLTVNRPGTNYVGLFGYVGAGAVVRDLSLEGGTVTGGSYTGGLVGRNDGGAITSCTVSCTVTATSTANLGYVGGLVGRNAVGSITNGSAAGAVTATNTGGSYNTEFVGGLVGLNSGSMIANCHATGAVTAANTGTGTGTTFVAHVGGLAGCNGSSSTTTGSYATGAVTASNAGTGSSSIINVGGLVGFNYRASTVADCYATGAVAGTDAASGRSWEVGGLVGSNDTTGTVTNCYAAGPVAGISDVGGLMGGNGGSTVTDCYATGPVTGSSNVGGLVGWRGSASTVTSCYWDIETTGQTASAGGTGETTAQMTQQATYVGWDFAAVWDMAAWINDGYPYLRALGAAATPPHQAKSPDPANGATWQMLDVALVWQNGGGATSYNVYLGTTNPPVTKVATAQTGTVYVPASPLSRRTTYFWRIDATNPSGTTTGDVWHFTTLSPPNKPTAPTPADGATSQTVAVALGWQNGGGATGYDVYLGTENPPVVQVSNAQAATAFALATPLEYGTTYFWRIDAKNPAGTTAGDVWSFTTVPAAKVPGHFLSRRVKSSHSEKWDGQGARIVAKDAYSFSAKMQLPVDSLASISNATTLTLVLGDAVTSGAACVVIERPLSAATKSTLAGHPTAKKPKDPTRGGSVTFVELQPNSKKKARVVTIKWTKTGVLTATVVGAPALANWDPADPAQRREVENIADLCDGAEWPEGVATGVAVPTRVDLRGVFAGAETVACGGKKSVKPSDGGDLVGWSISGK